MSVYLLEKSVARVKQFIEIIGLLLIETDAVVDNS